MEDKKKIYGFMDASFFVEDDNSVLFEYRYTNDGTDMVEESRLLTDSELQRFIDTFEGMNSKVGIRWFDGTKGKKPPVIYGNEYKSITFSASDFYKFGIDKVLPDYEELGDDIFDEDIKKGLTPEA